MRTREGCSAGQSTNRLRQAAQTALAVGLLLGLGTAAHEGEIVSEMYKSIVTK